MATTRPFGSSWWPRGCPKPDSAGWHRLPWPDDVPVLAAKDAARSHEIPLREPPYALDGWLDAVFGRDLSSRAGRWVSDVAGIAVASVVKARTGRDLAAWEYSLEASPADIASAWNAAIALLGYDAAPPVVAAIDEDDDEAWFR